MRPKSSATVVVLFCSMPARSSTPALASVSTSSVRSGTISLTDPTIVVLPAPNPPAMTIFTAVGAVSVSDIESPLGAWSEPADTIEHRLE